MQNKAQAAHTFKIGTTLVIPAQALDDAGVGINLTNITVKSQLRTEDGKAVATLDIQWIDRPNGSYALWLPGDGTTADYKPGRYVLDVFYTEQNAGFGGRPVVVATDTLTIDIGRAETVLP
jgi:hypothetical protein